MSQTMVNHHLNIPPVDLPPRYQITLDQGDVEDMACGDSDGSWRQGITAIRGQKNRRGAKGSSHLPCDVASSQKKNDMQSLSLFNFKGCRIGFVLGCLHLEKK